jgi:hypothetical protein
MAPPVHLAESRMEDGLLLVNPMALATADDALLVQQIVRAAQDAWPSASGTGPIAER